MTTETYRDLGRELLERLDDLDTDPDDLLDWILGDAFRGRLRAVVAADNARQAAGRRQTEALRRRMADFLPGMAGPRWRFWELASGWRFGWTTERDRDGKFYALEWRPVGPGSRTGQAKRHRQTRAVGFRRRSSAKARAEQWRRTRQKKETP